MLAGRRWTPSTHLTVRPPCQQVAVPRGLWDDSTGFVTLTKYASAESRAGLEAGMLQSLPGGYLAYAAAGALLRWGFGAQAGSTLGRHVGMLRSGVV